MLQTFTAYIGSQFGNPRGIVGKLCCLMMNAINQGMYRSVTGNLALGAEDRCLDIGCGNGYLLQQLDRRFSCRLYGVDPSKDALRLAAKRNQSAIAAGKIRLTVGDCSRLPYPEELFDAVTSVNTIYFWPDTVGGLQEILRVLKPNGVFYNAVYSKQWLQKLAYTRKGFELFERQDYIEQGRQAGFGQCTVREIVQGKSYLVQYQK